MRHHATLFAVLLCTLLHLTTGAKWTTLTAAGTHRAREETTLVSCGGTKLCLLGGRQRVPTPILDTATLSWTEGPAPPVEMHHFQGATGEDGCAYIIGAWTGSFPGEQFIELIYRYCAEKEKFEAVAKIPRPRGAGGTVYYNGLFYMVSGNVGGHRLSAQLVPWFDSYNPRTKEWKVLPDIPHPRDHVNVVVAGGKLYVAGGRDSSDKYPKFFDMVETNVDVYDFATAKWSTLPAPFPRGRAGASAIVYKGAPWVAGGEGFGRAWTEVDVLSGGEYVAGPAMPHPRHGFGMVECNNVVWVAGGAGVQGGGTPQMKLDAYFDGTTPAPCVYNPKQIATAPKPIKTPAINPTKPVTSTSPAKPSAPSGAVSTPEPETANAPSVPVFPTKTASPPTETEGADDTVDTPPSEGDSNALGDSSEPAATSDATATSSASASSSEAACFPAHATVRLADGSDKAMSALTLGDRVLVAHPDSYSEVYFFSHAHESHISDFVHIRTALEGVSLQLSERHLVYANGALVEARNVRVGDKVSVAHDERIALVVGVEHVAAKGLYNPHTLHGDIVVNGVTASTLTRTLHPSIARVLLSPFQATYKAFGPHPVVHSLNRGVLHTLERLVW